MNDFLRGMLVMGAGVVALFFIRFWRQTRDRLFLFFAGCFLILGVHWFLLVIFGAAEDQVAIFTLRVAAFGLLIAGVLDKNWRRPTGQT